MREFATGATRDDEGGKLDYEGFLSPLVLEAFARYMHAHQVQADGKVRPGDNWQRGIPRDVYMKSMWRHFMDCWKHHRGLPVEASHVDALMALAFNVMGYAYEVLTEPQTPLIAPYLTSVAGPVITASQLTLVTDDLAGARD